MRCKCNATGFDTCQSCILRVRRQRNATQITHHNSQTNPMSCCNKLISAIQYSVFIKHDKILAIKESNHKTIFKRTSFYDERFEWIGRSADTPIKLITTVYFPSEHATD